MTALSQAIFKAYDIRGIIGENLDEKVAYLVACAFAKKMLRKSHKTILIGRDGRLSGAALKSALSRGFQACGIDVIDIGMVATPLLYYATHLLNVPCGIMVTGSHNPPDYNGFKMVLGSEAIYGEQIQSLYHTIIQKDFSLAQNEGTYRTANVHQQYIERIVSDVKLSRPMKVVIDCGNGVAGAFAGDLYRAMGCEVIELFCDVDGHFPNHHPDPAHPENLQDLAVSLMQGDSEIGLAFDGDGDRLGVVTREGEIIFPDRQLMFFAKDVLQRWPGQKILYDVKSTRNIANWVRAYGGEPMMCQTGHSLIKAKMRETGAPLGGEMSGHLFFKDRWYGFDDGLYAGARLLEILSRTDNPSALLMTLPQSLCTPELQLKLNEGENYLLIKKLQQTVDFPDALEQITIDGLRIEYKDGFGLARASNTTPAIVFRFEADSSQALERIQHDFKRAIVRIKPNAILPI